MESNIKTINFGLNLGVYVFIKVKTIDFGLNLGVYVFIEVNEQNSYWAMSYIQL